jgi:four helix bundle protein
MAVKVFTDLLIWRQRARQWSKAIFEYTQSEPFNSNHHLAEQMNNSSASVMANIAEGFGRDTRNEFVMFLGYALGSLNETQSHLTGAYDRRHIPKDVFRALFAEGTEIRKMTVSFITSMVVPGGGAKTARKPRPEFFRNHALTNRPVAETPA